MPFVRVINTSHPEKFTINADYCVTFLKRLKGLMFVPTLKTGEGILLVEKSPSILSSSIHMFFMNFDILVIWLDDYLKVVDFKLAKRWHPFYVSSRPARFILETHPDYINEFRNGDQISIENI